MWNRTAARLAIGVGAIGLLSACSDDPLTHTISNEPDMPLFSANPTPGQAPRTLDDEFARINEEVPGFGGMYYNSRGELTAVLAAGGARIASGEFVNQLQTQLGGAGPRSAALAQMTVQDGQYDFLTLRDYKGRLGGIFGVTGVVFTDVDEVANRVRIGVLNISAEAQVQRELERAGVPREAVIVSVTEPIEQLAHTLRDVQRPAAGGLQIWRLTSPTSASICTLGFNIRSAGSRAQGFITNSHCTAEQGVMSSTQWAQKQLVLPHEPIGFEAHDAPFFPCQYTGYRCRYSDAAGGVYKSATSQHGAIFRTTASGTSAAATLDIDHGNPQFTITEERSFPLVGDVLNKIGRTSGWTTGPVSQTCIDTGVSNTNPPIAMLCQDRVVAFSAPGDSGSPVFERIGTTGNVRLVGILWGGSGSTFVISSMSNIRLENQGPWTTYPGQTPPM